MGTPKLKASVASMSEEQKGDALVFLECNTEELAVLLDSQGLQAVANVRTLLDYLPIHVFLLVYVADMVVSSFHHPEPGLAS